MTNDMSCFVKPELLRCLPLVEMTDNVYPEACKATNMMYYIMAWVCAFTEA